MFGRSVSLVAASMLVSLLAPLAAGASDAGPIQVKSGVQTVVMSYASYDPDTCTYAALPVLRIVKPPAHGTLEAGKFAHKVAKGPCAGSTFKSSAAAYRSKSGFRGRDEMVVEATMDLYSNVPARQRTDTVHIVVDVK
jgi:hypothetical protein